MGKHWRVRDKCSSFSSPIIWTALQQKKHLVNIPPLSTIYIHLWQKICSTDHILAFLMGCASRFAAKNNPLNFVPPLHEFFWLSDACIQIKWHSPTPSSPSFLAWRWLRCWRKKICSTSTLRYQPPRSRFRHCGRAATETSSLEKIPTPWSDFAAAGDLFVDGMALILPLVGIIPK